MSVSSHCVCDDKQEFEDARDADDAVYDLNGKVLCGKRYLTTQLNAIWSVISVRREVFCDTVKCTNALQTTIQVTLNC